jgi:hypothetical protein
MIIDMLGNVFVDKATGEQVEIVNEDTNFYVLNNNVRIKKDIFAKKYKESAEVDPDKFFQQQRISNDPLANIANQLKNLDTSKINDVASSTQVKYTPPIVLADSSNTNSQNSVKQQKEETIHLTLEQKKAMLEEWRKTQPGAQIPTIQEKNYDEDQRFSDEDRPVKVEPKQDPMKMMFQMFKNNYLVKLNVEIEENIPNPTFIGMVQENVEADAVQYYADLITDKILKDSSKLKMDIYTQLKKIINKELGVEEKNN